MRYLALATALVAAPLHSQSYEHKSQLSPSDYLMNSYGKKSDPVFDQFATIDLGMSFGIGADCGRINMKETLKASFDNILNHEYFEDLSHTIIAGAPMLAACYLSPTWCSILKNTQVNATFLANLRMNQCAAIDKYTDQRVEDYQQQRQQCVRNKIAEKNGNFEQAMNECSGDFYQADIANWAGNGDTIENKLLESSAKWAGFSGQEADRTVSLVKAFVGDTIVKRGKVSVDFGLGRKPVTPRTYLVELEKKTYSDLCDDILRKIENNGGAKANIDNVVTDQDLKRITTESDTQYVDRQTLRSLILMPYKQRQVACKKLSDSVAMTMFTNDMAKSLDFLTSRVETNPNLPEHRKREAQAKRVALKDQVEVTLSLYKHKNEPLNNVLTQINAEGAKYADYRINQNMRDDASSKAAESSERSLFDCSDATFCNP